MDPSNVASVSILVSGLWHPVAPQQLLSALMMNAKQLVVVLLALPWVVRISITAALCVGSALWAWSVVRLRVPGLPRLVTALPVIVVFWTVPKLFSGRSEEGQSLASTIAMFLWLASFKVRTSDAFAWRCTCIWLDS